MSVQRGDACFLHSGQSLQREGDGPQGAFVEVCLVAETERRVPRWRAPSSRLVRRL
jgi:hypothetical protein